MTKFRSSISSWPLYPLFRYALLVFSLLSLSRLLLIAWQYPRVGSVEHALTVLMFGLRFDLIVLCLLWIVPALLLLFLPRTKILNGLSSVTARLWLMLSTIIVLFMEMSTPAFIDQYDTRPNRIFFEYLETPVEGVTSALYEYPWHFVVAFILLGLLIRYLLNFNRRIFSDLKPWPVLARIILLPLLLVFFGVGIRSSFDHRPANPSIAAFSNDQLVNKLGLSSMYTVLTAAYNLRHEDSASSVYGEMAPEKMVSLVRLHSLNNPASFVEDATSTWHRQNATNRSQPGNLVIILEESLGAGFVGSLGGIGVTPEIDKLAQQGLWFSRLYATGTRSARGIEAVTAGFPPSPSRSVLKLGLAQQNFVTLASILKRNNYDTQFIYGGESHFDNMAGFFLANGFDRVTDQNDYENPRFRGTWGVSDEDLFDRVDQELMRGSANPQFILAFSSSNHTPFEFPDNTIELHDAEKNTVNNAVKYADYAVGRFFDKARTRPYWDNSFFLVVADHDDRVHGAALVPIDKFHIPGVIIGPGIEPATHDKPASQIDLIPTLLDTLGISSTHPMIGHNLRQLPADFAGRAMMQYDNNHAYMSGNDVVIHIPEKAPQQFSYETGELKQTPLDAELAEVARAHILWPMYAYRELKYLYQP
jgi:phosphoglycerol transferase MdoB-like AlkP superfamily enzyme